MNSKHGWRMAEVTDTELSNALRFLAIYMIEEANSGHPGIAMGMADVITVLYKDFLSFNPKYPSWEKRDRLIFSAGHGSALLYASYYLAGFEDFSIKELKNFRKLGSKTPGHPEYRLPVECTTGPLGQGLAMAVGMAISAKKKGENHKIYVVLGDGCLMEGISQEALSLASHLCLNNLILIFDDNHITIDGRTELSTSEVQTMRLLSLGFEVELTIDGHDHSDIRDALKQAQNSDLPTFLAFNTSIGYGSPSLAGTCKVHGTPLGKKEVAKVRENLNWPHAPFVIPENILKTWRNFYLRTESLFDDSKDNDNRSQVNEDYHLSDLKKSLCSEAPIVESTRKSSNRVLSHISCFSTNLIGGSADLTPSNLTMVSGQKPITKENYSGNYIHYGIREHAMAGVMNGIALDGKFIPYGGTFLVFSDYMRPGIRLSALMRQRVIYIFTHDSIGVGEDGPTHQPVEQLGSLRLIPNLQVLRPCDVIETLECFEMALKYSGPSAIILTRQDAPQLRNTYNIKNLSSFGAYILLETDGNPDVTIFASGSEVALALNVAQKLPQIKIRVVSVPELNLFNRQSESYKSKILGKNSLKVVIEAAKLIGWRDVIGDIDIPVGMDNFGRSAPAEVLFKRYGFCAEKIATLIEQKLRQNRHT